MTKAVRSAAFPLDELPEERALNDVWALTGDLPAWPVSSGPERRCRITARELRPSGAPEPTEAAALADRGSGQWAGRTLDTVAETDPAGLQAWLSDPEAAPGGTEPLVALLSRVAGWLDAPDADSRRIAVTHPAVVRASLVHALGAPPSAFWRIDVPPVSVVELRGGRGRWSLRPWLPARPWR